MALLAQEVVALRVAVLGVAALVMRLGEVMVWVIVGASMTASGAWILDLVRCEASDAVCCQQLCCVEQQSQMPGRLAAICAISARSKVGQVFNCMQRAKFEVLPP